ncbi:MFS general substrate transporter [Aspergillus steynii IBT 23096]|uniref:MFS general substrate transporter n=1 Tax=Aspergillus steynii IBT 23096 TaxID=1392250 RepID=A0A2I2FUD5_9EURO|nr:MFS general substrate transporter [Aspergillus steynii IBT 23096]PLB44207.1 MFS general substrate transporter [Aspergillus steynii IBT 23096]
MTFLGKLREVVWGKPAPTKQERKLVFKLDCIIMPFICLMYWVNYLDRSNLTNAYVSGLKEDLKMYGTEYNQINSVFYVGYTVSQIPNNIILQKVSPQVYLTISMICWSFLTLGLAFVNGWHQIMGIRFCLGIFESATFVGSHYIMGSWYNQQEIGKRTAVFAASGVAGNMFSGFLQGAIYKNMNGLDGRAGWRWMFIIDFLITIPVACLGYFVFPGHPETTKSKFLTPEEKSLATERLPEPLIRRGALGWSLVRRVILSWEIYALSLLAVLAGDTEMWADNGILNIYLKYLGTYSVELVNYIPTAVYAIALVSILLCSWYADYFQKAGGRWHVGVFLSVTAIISGAIMLKPPSIGAKLFALFLNGIQLGYRGVLFAWANDLMRKDDAKRGIVIGMMNAMTIAFYIFWTLLFYNTDQSPMWYEGSIALIVTGVCMIFSVGSVVFFERREAKNTVVVLEGESTTVGSDQDNVVVHKAVDKRDNSV